MPPPSTSSVEDSITGIFICCSCLSCCEKTARGNPLATTASGRSFDGLLPRGLDALRACPAC